MAVGRLPDNEERRPLPTTDVPTNTPPTRTTVPAFAARTMRRGSNGRTSRPVFVSLYAPQARRTWWWYAYRCPGCGAYQLGRARSLDAVTGDRRAGCGHWIRVNIARVYGNSAVVS